MTILRRLHARRVTAFSVLIFAAWFVGLEPVFAQTFTWSGNGGASDQWSNSLNWSGGILPTVSTMSTVLFSANTSTPSLNDIQGLSIGQISFTSGQTQQFAVSGSSVNLYLGLNTASVSTQTVSFSSIGVGVGQSWYAATGSTMVVTSAINGNGNTLELGLGGQGGNLILSGVISSTGDVIVTGPGMTAFTSAFNTYSGTTTIDGGFLTINSDLNLGVSPSTVVFINGGTIQTPLGWNSSRYISLASGTANVDTFGQNDTLAGVISGAGSLVKIGSGTLTLDGVNTYTGGTTISSGTISISTDANLGAATGSLTLVNNSTLVTTANMTSARAITLNGTGGILNPVAGTSLVLNGAIGGAGALTKTGGGSLSLEAVNTFGGGLFVDGGTVSLGAPNNTYGGGTTLNSGTLELGALNALPTNGALTLASGTTFDMNGNNQTNSLGTVVNNGTINVGESALTLNNGYSGTGTVTMTIDKAAITGNGIDFTGGTLSLSVSVPVVSSGTTYTPINGTGIVGSTSTVNVVSPAALSFTPTYSATSVSFLVGFIPYSSLAATPNQQVVATILDSLRSTPTGSWAAVFAGLNTLSLPQLQEAFDEIGPISLVAMRGLGLESSTVQSAALSQRMAVLAKGGDASGVSSYTASARGRSFYPGTLVASAIDDIGSPAPVEFKSPGSPWGFFSAISGTDGRVDPISGAAGEQPGYHTNTYGLTAGGDYRFMENFAAGVSGSWLSGHASIDSPASGSVGNHSARLGVYGTAAGNGLVGNFYLGGAVDDFQTNRDVVIGSFLRTATAAPQAHELNAYTGGSYDLLASAYGMLASYAGLNYDRLMIGSFSESGADPLNLNISAQTAQSLRSSLGFKYSQNFEGTTPYLSAGWRHEFLDQSEPIQAELVSTGNVFTVNTADMPKDGLLVGAGVSTNVGENLSVKADYSGDFRDHFSDNAFDAAARYRF